MKSGFIFLLPLALWLAGCEPPAVYFHQPQPPGTGELDRFPARLQGSYTHTGLPMVLDIGPDLMTRTLDYDYDMHRDSLEAGSLLQGDTLVLSSGVKEPVVLIQGNQLRRHVHEKDTLFALNDSGVLKKFKGSYFLNIRKAQDRWLVQRLNLQRGMLTLGAITDSMEIARLKNLADTTADTNGMVFRPTRRQFRHWIREDGFRDRDTFYRIFPR